MKALRLLLLFVTLSLLVLFSHGKTKSTAPKLSFGSLSRLDLEAAHIDGDVLFDLSWPGSEAKEQGLQVQL